MTGQARRAPSPVKEKRRDITTMFFAFLTAVAYQEMVNPVREAVQAQGITWPLAALFITFLVTTIRFMRSGAASRASSQQLMAAIPRLRSRPMTLRATVPVTMPAGVNPGCTRVAGRSVVPRGGLG